MESNQTSHWNGKAYNKISFPQYEINKAFIDAHVFLGDERILDVGCGNGNTTKLLAQKIPRGSMLGIDASSSMIEAAKLENSIPNVNFSWLDAQLIDFDKKFNLVTCFFCMQWIPDKIGVFKKIARALVKDGYFLLIVPLPHPHLPQLRNQLISENKWQDYFSDYQDPLIYINDCDYKAYAAAANLQLISYTIERNPVFFSSYTEFFAFMHQMTPHLSALSNENLKNDFLNELLNRYVQIYPRTADGQYQLNFDLVKMKARLRS